VADENTALDAAAVSASWRWWRWRTAVMVRAIGLLSFRCVVVAVGGLVDVFYVNRMSKRGQKTDPQKWELKNLRTCIKSPFY
jgi:hypothetical protein